MLLDKTSKLNFLSYVSATCLMLLSFLVLPQTTLAWDMSGHRLSAEIAYQNLSACSRKQVVEAQKTLLERHGFVRGVSDFAAFPDYLKVRGKNKYNRWHYINKPWLVEGKPKKFQLRYMETKAPNLEWAMQTSLEEFNKPFTSRYRRAFYLSFLWHLIGDIHQPLHTISRFDLRTPKGDRGGLYFKIHHGEISNLHHLWDMGIDHYGQAKRDYPFRRRQITTIAKTLQKKFPQTMFAKNLKDKNVEHWIQESVIIAKKYVYRTPFGKKPSKHYLKQASDLAQQQIVLSGYRMAQYTEDLFGAQCGASSIKSKIGML